MFNHQAIDKTPTVNQIKAIIDYMESNPNESYNFNLMLNMTRIKSNLITIDLNNAHSGATYDVLFNDDNEIISFNSTGFWMS